MIIFVLIIGLLCLYNLKLPLKKNAVICYENGIFNDYMSLEKTTSIKGIFILIVFVNHAVSYLTLNDTILDKSYNMLIGNFVGQSMVSLFLFYSGYGVILSIDKKGRDYIKSIPTKRFLKVLLHFDIAVLLFLVLSVALGKEITFVKVLLSFVGWDSLGNSNWYIFDILTLYLITYISFIIARNNKFVGLVINFVLCAVFVIAMHEVKDLWWYDTIMCYPVGMLFYVIKPYFDEIIKKNKVYYWVSLIALVGALGVCIMLSSNMFVLFVKHIVFAMVVVVATMKFSINNKILNFLGTHLFSIYILERIPMNILSEFGLTNKYLFVALSFVATIPICIAFDFAMKRLDAVLFSKKSLSK